MNPRLILSAVISGLVAGASFYALDHGVRWVVAAVRRRRARKSPPDLTVALPCPECGCPVPVTWKGENDATTFVCHCGTSFVIEVGEEPSLPGMRAVRIRASAETPRESE